VAEVDFRRIVCDDPQNGEPGADEVYLRFDPDGGGPERSQRTPTIDNMDKNDLRLLSSKWEFDFSDGEKPEVTLFEEDRFNPDDKIAKVSINTQPSGNAHGHDAVFETDGVRYVINYEITV
jgi:hypothetical protein